MELIEQVSSYLRSYISRLLDLWLPFYEDLSLAVLLKSSSFGGVPANKVIKPYKFGEVVLRPSARSHMLPLVVSAAA